MLPKAEIGRKPTRWGGWDAWRLRSWEAGKLGSDGLRSREDLEFGSGKRKAKGQRKKVKGYAGKKEGERVGR